MEFIAGSDRKLKLIMLVAVLQLVFILSGCTIPKPVPVVYDCPIVDLPPDPVPATRKLTVKSRPDEVVKAWVATAKAYKQWNTIVRQEVENSD